METTLRIDKIECYEEVKTKLVPSLLNRENNGSFLDMVPHRDLLDLAVIYRIDYGMNNGVRKMLTITNKILEILGVTEDELYRDAVQNTALRYPLKIRTLFDVLCGMMGDEESESTEGEDDLYVATTPDGLLGARVLLYPDFFKQAAEKLGGSFFVLPSSIHEVLLLQDNGKAVVEDLSAMVRQVNAAEVREKDQLSNHVYYYDAESDEFCIAGETHA